MIASDVTALRADLETAWRDALRWRRDAEEAQEQLAEIEAVVRARCAAELRGLLIAGDRWTVTLHRAQQLVDRWAGPPTSGPAL